MIEEKVLEKTRKTKPIILADSYEAWSQQEEKLKKSAEERGRKEHRTFQTPNEINAEITDLKDSRLHDRSWIKVDRGNFKGLLICLSEAFAITRSKNKPIYFLPCCYTYWCGDKPILNNHDGILLRSYLDKRNRSKAIKDQTYRPPYARKLDSKLTSTTDIYSFIHSEKSLESADCSTKATDTEDWDLISNIFEAESEVEPEQFLG